MLTKETEALVTEAMQASPDPAGGGGPLLSVGDELRGDRRGVRNSQEHRQDPRVPWDEGAQKKLKGLGIHPASQQGTDIAV